MGEGIAVVTNPNHSFFGVSFINPPAIPQDYGLRSIPAKRGVESPATPTAYKSDVSQPRGDLVRVVRGNLGFFVFVFSFCVLFYAGEGSLGRWLARSHAREDKANNEGTDKRINSGTNKKKGTMDE